MRKSSSSFLSALVLLTVAISLPLAAQTTIHIPADQPTIQAGINAAKAGDTVLVSPGTYYENIDFKGKGVTVTSVAGAGTTIIDGGAAPGLPTVAFQNKETSASVLSGFTVRNGGDEPFATQTAGGVYIGYLSAPVVTRNTITANGCANVLTNVAGPATISNNEISSVLPLKSGFNSYCPFRAGITVFGNAPGTNLTFQGNTIENNTGGYAGGVVLWGGESVRFISNIIRNNNGSEGGAVWSANTDAMIFIGNLITGNTASGSGFAAGGMSLQLDGSGQGPATTFLINNTIAFNTVGYYTAGSSASDLFIDGPFGDITLVNNVLVGKFATQAVLTCGSVYSYLSGTPPVIDHNDVFNTAGGPAYGGACTDVIGTYGNISVPPGFLATNAAGDFHQLANSPAIDTGNDSAPMLPLVDLDGNKRPVDSTGANYPVVDMGAYEAAALGPAAAYTTLTLTPSTFYPYTAPFTLALSLASTLGVPTGPINVFEDGQLISTVNPDSHGAATVQPPIKPGVHAFLATYAGQAQFSQAVSVVVYVLFPRSSTTLTIKSSSNPSLLGSSVNFTVTASAGDGSVPSPIALADGPTTLATLTPSSSGIATFTTSALAAGSHLISATFAGDATRNSTSASVYQTVVNPYATIISVSATPNPAILGSSVTLSASVTSAGGTAPTGSIAFTYGSMTLGTQAVTAQSNGSSTASIATSSLPLGFDTVTATFTPTGSYTPGSNSAYIQIVNGYATTTTLSSSLNPSNVTQSVTFTANVGSQNNAGIGPPTGSVTFNDGSTPLATVPLSAQANGNVAASYSTAALSVGVHSINATYTPTGSFSGSSAALTQTVRSTTPPTGAVTVSPEPGVVERDNLVFTATLTPPAAEAGALYSGSITFSGNGIGCTATLGGGNSATCTDSAIHPAGTYAVTAVYSGDALHPGASFTATHVINTLPIAPSITAAANPIAAGQTATLYTKFNVVYAPRQPFSLSASGTLTYFDGGVAIAQVTSPDPNVSSVQLPGLAPGQHVITVSYSGDNYFSPGTSPPFTLTVQAAVTLTLRASSTTVQAGQPDTFTVLVTPVGNNINYPNGTVTYFADGQQIGVAPVLNVGIASLTFSNFNAGPHVITCNYSGDSVYAPASCTPLNLNVTAVPTVTTLSSSANPGFAFTAVNYIATVTSGGQPLQGSVSFDIDGSPTRTVVPTNAAGMAVLPAGLAVGTHVITASYIGNGNYSGSNAAPLNETIIAAPTSITLTAAPNPAPQGQAVSIVATIAAPNPPASPVPSIGSIQFFDGTISLGSLPAQNSQVGIFFATLTTSTLAPGTHTITAVYTPAGVYAPDYLPSSSAALTLVINPSNVILTTAAPALTLKTEHHGDLGVTLTSVGGLTGRFTLTCGALPYPASCAWGTTSVYLPASGSITTNLHVDTDIVLGFKASAEPAAGPQRGWMQGVALAAMLPLGLLAFARRKRLAGLAVLLVLATGLSGCGDKYPAHVAPGTYAVQVTATGTPAGASAPVTKTVTFNLVVTE